MIKVHSYINTLGGKRFRKFLLKPFTIDMLAPVFGEASVDTLFDGWLGKDMINWHRFRNTEKIVLEFYPEGTYIIKDGRSDKTYELKIPKTINDFINDMERLEIPIYWTAWIDENFEPKEYLDADGVKDYFIDLLAKMGKSQELL
jgi:hypothetical protein